MYLGYFYTLRGKSEDNEMMQCENWQCSVSLKKENEINILRTHYHTPDITKTFFVWKDEIKQSALNPTKIPV